MSELRKVQRTPSGTFFVSLPKAWSQQYGLERGTVVAISATDDGKLLIDPKYDVGLSPRAITLKPSTYLGREIMGKYLLGFDIIRVESKDRLSPEVRDIIKKSVSGLVGLEIVEEDYAGIVLQCLLEPSGFPPEKILRRGYTIAASMHRDVVNALVDEDLRLAKNVVDRDDEVNRLYFLSVRILRTIIQNPGLSEKLGVRQIECLDYRLAASLVEAIGDECVHAAQKIRELNSAKLATDLKKAFVNFYTACSEAHEKAVKAFLAGDIGLAEDVRNMRQKVTEIFADIEKIARAQSLDIVPQILAVASALGQIYEHSVDISDLVMPKKV